MAVVELEIVLVYQGVLVYQCMSVYHKGLGMGKPLQDLVMRMHYTAC